MFTALNAIKYVDFVLCLLFAVFFRFFFFATKFSINNFHSHSAEIQKKKTVASNNEIEINYKHPEFYHTEV